MNIFIHELKAYWKSTVIWTLSLIAIAALFMSLFPSFAKDAEEYKKLLEGYPAAVREALGINLGNLFTILGFYGYALTFITLCGAVQAMNLGTSIVSKEVRDKTADFLMTKPVTRGTVLTSKILAGFLSLIITNLVYLAAAAGITFQVKTDDFSLKVFFLLSLTVFFIQLLFLAIGILISVVVPKIKSVIAVSLSTVFAFYFLGIITSTTSEADVKRYLSPFTYFDTGYIIKNSGYEASFLIVGAVLVILAAVISYYVYLKKDIHAV